jgi:hypothetical protein
MCFPHISLNLHASSHAIPIIKAVFYISTRSTLNTYNYFLKLCKLWKLAENLTFNVETQRPCNQNIIRSSFVWLAVCISRDVRTSVTSTIVVEGTLIWWNLQVGISKSRMLTSIGVLFFQNSSIRFFDIFTMIPGGYPAGTHWVLW